MTSQESVATRIDTRWTSGRHGVNQSGCTAKCPETAIARGLKLAMCVGSMSPKEREQAHLSMQGYRQGAEIPNEGSMLCTRAFQRIASVGDTQVSTVISCDGRSLRSRRTVGSRNLRHLSCPLHAESRQNCTLSFWTLPRHQEMGKWLDG